MYKSNDFSLAGEARRIDAALAANAVFFMQQNDYAERGIEVDYYTGALIETLNGEDWKVRGAAAWALGNLGDEKAIPELEKLLDDESGFVKQGAQSAINSIKK